MPFLDYSFEQIAGIAVALVVGITFHEFSHAFTALQLGDHRPAAMGRVSLNPARHIDPIGAIVFFLAGFGWGRPVLVNPAALRPGRIGMAIVAAAGPISNVVVAVAFAIVFRVLDLVGGMPVFVMALLFYIVFFNLVLAILNLVPIPPLDGSNVALALLPPRQALAFQRYAPYGIIVLLLLVFVPNSPLRWLLGLAGPLAQGLVGA